MKATDVRPPASKQRGFTLVELITVMIIMGILAVNAMPRFADQSSFQTRGFVDETRALLRFAQKSAIAQRRTVCVALNSTGLGLSIDKNTSATGNCNTSSPALDLPLTPRGGTGLSASVSSFKFNPLGDTDQSANIVITIAGSTITVDNRTGYAY